MKNKYPGKCYRCGQPVGPGDGHFEPHSSRGRVRHDSCKPLKGNKVQLGNRVKESEKWEDQC